MLKNIDEGNLSDNLKYEKWCIETPDKSTDGKEDKDISKFKSLAFLSSEEFKKWSDKKKVFAFQNYGEKNTKA